MKTTLNRKHRLWRGFSLPEVTMALGISALGISSTLGLLPQGLDNMRKASSLTAEARINQFILGDIEQANWKDAAGGDLLSYSYNGRRYIFDEMAQSLELNQPGEDTAYVAEVHVDTAGVAVPGGEVDGDLRRVTVKVKNTGQPNYNFAEAAPGSFRTYAMVVGSAGN